MSTNLRDLSPIPLPDDKPSNRGRFSDDRQYWEEVHKRRYLQWQGGDGIEDAIRTLETLPKKETKTFGGWKCHDAARSPLLGNPCTKLMKIPHCRNHHSGK